MSLLFFSGTLSFSELLAAILVFVFSSMAFYLSTDVDEKDMGVLTRFAAARVVTDQDGSMRPIASMENSAADIAELIRAYPHPALICDASGRVEFYNQDAADILKLPRKTSGLATATLRRADIIRQIEALGRGETPDSVFVEVPGTPDRFFRVDSVSLKLRNDNQYLIVLIELTEVRRAEKARADFLANASHELRTPLTSLAGFIETMRGPAKDDPEAWDRFLEIMYGQTERMRGLIHDLLSLSRIELSEHRKPDQIVRFTALAHEGFEAMQPISREKQIQLELIDSADDVEVYGVRDELHQVVQNLVDNAIKYTRADTKVVVEIATGLTIDEARLFTARRWPDAARISILQSRIEPEERVVAFRVSDEGLGISREHLPRLGERFYRVDEGRDRSIGGTGLGLAIVKHILARHRGGLSVESEVNRGTAFGFWLPEIASEAQDGPEQKAQEIS